MKKSKKLDHEQTVNYLTNLLDVDGVEPELVKKVSLIAARAVEATNKHSRREDDPDEGRLLSAFILNEIYKIGYNNGIILTVRSLHNAILTIEGVKLDDPP
jgi:hypothetical protein